MKSTRPLLDPISGKNYDYVTRDDKEERLYKALQMSLNDDCPPDRQDYLCMSDESEEQRCDACWIRWATKDFGIPKK